MSISFRSWARSSAAAAALWTLCAGSAWAGGGGADAGTLQALLCQFASILNISCPQYPTYVNTTTTPATPISPLTPIVLELAAWQNISPDSVRFTDGDCGSGTPGPQFCPQVAVNATNGPARTPLSDAAAATSLLQPLAFVANPAPMVPLTVTQNFDPNATSYVYAAVEGPNGQPSTLDIFFRSANGTNTTHSKGQVVAAISFPLAVLVNATSVENSIVATLQITATCNGTAACLTANVLADLSGSGKKKMYNPADLGLNFAFLSGSSPTYEVQIPLLVNPQTDPVYFLGEPLSGCPNPPMSGLGSEFSGYCNAFSASNPPNGFAPKFLNKTVVGMAPSAAPQCPGNQPGTLCPALLPNNPPQPLSPTFGFCAFLSNSAYVSNTPDAAFYLAIGTDGTTYISSPVPPSLVPPSSLAPAPYPACPS
jgi:hypothetical protein